MQELSLKSGGGRNFGRGRNLGRVRYTFLRFYSFAKISKIITSKITMSLHVKLLRLLALH